VSTTDLQTALRECHALLRDMDDRDELTADDVALKDRLGRLLDGQAEPQRVFIVCEEEPETGTDFPSVIIGVYGTRERAEAVVRDKEAEHDGYDRDEADIWWDVEEHEVQA